MSAMENATKSALQAKVFDFAITELVLQHRDSFQPLWTVDSWAKFLIWLTLNCGLTGERKSLELFADALGPGLTHRMRRLFFERVLDEFSLHFIADPSEASVFVIIQDCLSPKLYTKVQKALEEVGLDELVVLDQITWNVQDALISIPWKCSESSI